MGILILLIVITSLMLIQVMSQKTPDYTSRINDVDFDKIDKILKK